MFAHAVNESAVLQQGCGVSEDPGQTGKGEVFIGVLYKTDVGVRRMRKKRSDKEREMDVFL